MLKFVRVAEFNVSHGDVDTTINVSQITKIIASLDGAALIFIGSEMIRTPISYDRFVDAIKELLGSNNINFYDFGE